MPWPIHMCSMTHSYVCHDSFIWVSWLIHMCAMTHSHVCHDSFIWTHSHVCHDSFIWVSWLIHMCAMTHSHVCHDSFTCVPWLTHMCAMTQDKCHKTTCPRLHEKTIRKRENTSHHSPSEIAPLDKRKKSENSPQTFQMQLTYFPKIQL